MKPRYMIHTIPEREWYVHGFLIPCMTAQGIARSRIKVWSDKDRLGNLMACMTGFQWCGEREKPGFTWHLQDDVVPRHNMALWTEQMYSRENIVMLRVICGFCSDHTYEEDTSRYVGWVDWEKMWWSFQCIGMDDLLAGECAQWFLDHGPFGVGWLDANVREGKGDDSIFRRFLEELYPDMQVVNLRPNLVQHVDDLLGGSVINKDREFPIRAAYWDDNGEMAALQRWLDKREKEDT